MPEAIAVDSAITTYLRQIDTKAAASLAATGEAGVHRMLGLWYGTATDPLPNPIPEVSSRDAIDRWSSALAIVASAAPSAFVDGIADLDMSTTLLAILGDVDDPRAITTLAEHIADEDWLTRYNAVSLAGPSERPGRQAVHRTRARRREPGRPRRRDQGRQRLGSRPGHHALPGAARLP